jgi:hypothetical protein
MGASNPRTLRGCKMMCSVPGCLTKRAYRTGLCPKHHQRYRKYGDPSVGGIPSGYVSKGTLTSSGYRMLVVRKDGESKRIFEHRHIMEVALGRELHPEESIHHLNGDRLDNRLENLELWSRSQPSGQRVEDLVTWATGFLRLYDS